ncbi:hypothetical protein Pla123a_13320 [Posidoniimonas polymericola]|uniref:Uncharacterized protein n=1 Tax=Posidoniimonas polymericola TaxID=2528002 RepID=A0A5C5YU49_9BACT|nr:hypothetical protein [Posidoniimonas polymericola]TWT78539.1 hypothetical protein Pla123a_13320 [Posidoniimonas polymericola]
MPAKRNAARTRTRTLARLAVLALIIALGAFKADQNRRDREAQRAYDDLIAQLDKEGGLEHQKLSQWSKSLFDADNARRETEETLNAGEPWETRMVADRVGDGREVATWRHPKYGIEMQYTFDGDDLASFTAGIGRGLLQERTPRPQPFSLEGPAESLRQLIPLAAGPIWLAGFAGAIFSARHGLLAAEAMLAAAFSTFIAHAVNPHTVMRITWFTDQEWFALLMLAASLVMLAWRAPARQGGLRFSMRELLIAMTAAAVLLAIGPFGWLMLGVLAASALLYAATRRLRPRGPAADLLAGDSGN